ncbi:MAG: M15 family metallopeptidase, partial [Lachnospiraceae bacterium]|nr:M15 family metallopeptidase [Lachnospiraceae bacterium]
MKRKWNVIMRFLVIAYLLTGCQKKGAVEMETEIESEIELSEESTSAITQDMSETEVDGSVYGLGEDRFETNTSEAISVEESILDVEDCFYYTALTEEIKERITGKSYPDTEESLQISYEDLAYVHVLHYDFQAQVQEGELICNQSIAQDLVDIFHELYESQYPIEKIRLIDEYDADDEASMADNNTSCFNYRTVPGRTKLSNHSYGCAIDINPLYN